MLDDNALILSMVASGLLIDAVGAGDTRRAWGQPCHVMSAVSHVRMCAAPHAAPHLSALYVVLVFRCSREAQVARTSGNSAETGRTSDIDVTRQRARSVRLSRHDRG